MATIACEKPEGGAKYLGFLYGKRIFANSFTVLARKASTIANDYHKSFDEMEIRVRDDVSGNVYAYTMTRINKKYPNGDFIGGSWK